MEKIKEDKLHKTYIWHIIALAKMKCNLKDLASRRINNG